MNIITNNTTFFANTIYDKLIKNNIKESYLEGGQESEEKYIITKWFREKLI